MNEVLRLSSLALFVAGPVVAGLALLRRGLKPSPTRSRIRDWRRFVPVVLLPCEWLLPPALIALRVGEIEASWLPVRVVGLAVGLAGAMLLVWASAAGFSDDLAHHTAMHIGQPEDGIDGFVWGVHPGVMAVRETISVPVLIAAWP
jgi:hypothetical protein